MNPNLHIRKTLHAPFANLVLGYTLRIIFVCNLFWLSGERQLAPVCIAWRKNVPAKIPTFLFSQTGSWVSPGK